MWEERDNMRNRAEAPLSNQTFQDVTAWRAIINIGGAEIKQPNLEQLHSITVFSSEVAQKIEQPHVVKSKDPQTVRITELNQQLALLWTKKHEGQISNREYRTQQQEFVKQLHEEMEKRGHRLIRTKKKHS